MKSRIRTAKKSPKAGKRRSITRKPKAQTRKVAAGKKPRSRTSEFEKLLASAARTPQRFVLKLYVTGTTPRSARAIQNISSLCDRHLADRYDLQIIDIYQQPSLASIDQIIAAPTLIRKLPMPLRKVIGDLSDEKQVLIGLDLSPKDNGSGAC